VTLGGTTLYAPDADWLNAAVEQIQEAIGQTLKKHLLIVRNQLEKLAIDRIGEQVSERVFGAVLGRSLRFGITSVLPCLTIHGHILRMYFHSLNRPAIEERLGLLNRLLSKNTAISVEAAQLACFPEREWGTKFIAKQLLSHLAYQGRAVFIDDDLFASPTPSLENALRNPHE
jgi:hypothetical protein